MNPFLLRIALMGALFTAVAAHAQRIAFVNTKYILEQMPDYQAAQTELDRFSAQWQKEIDDRWAQVKRLRDAYNAEAILLTEDMKRQRMEDIEKKEREARDLQKKRFGVEGDLFKKRQELVQPIQDRIYEAVKEVAGTSYVAVFDIGGMGNNVLYASDKYDKSDSVLRKLGIQPGKSGSNSGDLRGEEPSPDEEEQDNAQPQQGGRDGGGEAPPPQNPKK
ncbi:MAG: OmpH family outer membrane protein [Flavobacteriales bacterium]|nr:OmpH family outer membrane protein [Flavobacteriales bacterium]